MTQTHIEHPEDLILTGDLSVFNILYDVAEISMKMDGISLVWGTNPANDEFFVCTKAAFNKKKIRLCYTQEDIDIHFGHQPDLANKLSLCLTHLHRTNNIYWGDFLGFGGTNVLKPNTISYLFPETIESLLVIAPHTQVYVHNELYDSVCEPLQDTFTDSAAIKWVQPSVDRLYAPTEAPKINADTIAFLSKKEAETAKKEINAVIKSGRDLTDSILTDILGSPQLANLYQLVIEIKEDLIDSFIVNDAPLAFIFDDVEIDGEGFIFHSTDYGTVKLVDRPCFAYANFTTGSFQ
jgi:hypothetical protein